MTNAHYGIAQNRTIVDMPPYTTTASAEIEPNPSWGDLSSALNNILPYGNELAAEASEMLSTILHHIGLSLQAEDWAPGAIYWAKQLNQYLDLKYTLPLESRVGLAKVFYELTVAPGMDCTMIEAWSTYCRRLIKKKAQIGPDDLTLPWRPLYNLLEKILFPKNRQRALLSESKRMVKIIRLIEDAQRFFPPEAAKEILEEFLPQMTTSNLPALLKAQTYLCTFLPTDASRGMDPREWLPTVFRLWSLAVRSGEFDRNFMSLIGRVAQDNVGIKDMFTQSQSRAFFSIGLNALSLPVGKGQRANTVDAEGGTSHKAIGRNDEKPECATPQELRLTQALNDSFVETIKGVTFLTMFSKDQRAVAQTHMTLRYLAWISPKKIIPGVLERAYPSLESLTETHRTTSVISALGSLAVPMLNRENYPQGGKHLTPLLHLTVPGVDMNDPTKTWYTLLFVTSMIATVPIRDLTEMGSAGFQWGGFEEEATDAEKAVDLEAEDSIRKATTAEFEEWLQKFLRRAILMFENYPEANQGANKDAVENSITGSISYCFETLFLQLSPRLYEVTTRLILELLESTPLTNAGRAMGAFIECWAGADRESAMSKVFPILDREIRSELEHGASSVPSLANSHLSRDASLHYYQGLLNQLVLGSRILGHRLEILSMIRFMMEKCHDRKGYKLTAKLVHSALQNLLSIYTLDIRSHDREQWQDEEFMRESHNQWGRLGEPGTDKLDWHIPSRDEIDFAIELIDVFLVTSMARVRELIQSNTIEGKQLSIELCKSITMIKAFVAGMVNLVEDDGDSPVSRVSLGEDTMFVQPLKRIEVGYCLTDLNDPRREKIRKIRADIGVLLHELMTFFLTKREDDVENIKVLVKTARIYLSDHGTDSSHYDSNKKGFEFLKNMYKLPGDRKLYPRLMRCRRASIMQLLRLKVNSFGRAKTELHDALLSDLTELSLSRYTDVRKKSQQALLKAVRCFQGAKNLVIPVLLKALENSNTDNERMKGALFLLSAKSLSLPCLRDWRFAPDYVLRLCTAHHADKPSIQALVRKNFLEYIINMTNASFKVLVSKDLSSAIQELALEHRLKYDPDTLVRATNKVKNRQLNNIKAYDNLLVSLTEVVGDSSLHWRYQTMAMSFIEILVRPEIPCSLDIAQFESKSLLSEMPTVRRIALSTMSMLMVNIKVRTHAQGDPYSLIYH
ncbi:hypothetical protein BGZ94_008121 [Podila epigama]|nr:hypothetical protein BGZ94_008121 [Podila epigama]